MRDDVSNELCKSRNVFAYSEFPFHDFFEGILIRRVNSIGVARNFSASCLHISVSSRGSEIIHTGVFKINPFVSVLRREG